MPDVKRGLKNVGSCAIGCGFLLLILFAVVSVAGPPVGDAIRDATAPRPWKGVYDAQGRDGDDEGDFKTSLDCLAWGRKIVEAQGGSFKCGKDCTARRIGTITEYTCRTTVP